MANNNNYNYVNCYGDYIDYSGVENNDNDANCNDYIYCSGVDNNYNDANCDDDYIDFWVLKKRDEQRLEAAQMKFLRPLLGITKLDKEKNQSIRKKLGHRT
jgi:hypothetical protein